MVWKNKFDIAAVCLLICAACLRIFLAYNNWPLLNSDEGVMGMMALHIQEGQRPIFFYGQTYMGTLEAYLGAFFFTFFGGSTFSLRLGLILLFSLFLLCFYLLISTLYTKKFALFILLLLSLGSNSVLSRQLSAIGGYMETLFFGTLAFLLAVLLALSCNQASSSKIWRRVGYALWGLAIGLGLWSNLLILPAVFCSALLLVYFCWIDVRKGNYLFILVGLIVGALPLILYNVTAAPGQDSWSTLSVLQGKPPRTLAVMSQQLYHTLLYSLPTITANPLCHTDNFLGLQYLGFEPISKMNTTCIAVRMSWSGFFVLLLFVVFVTHCLKVYEYVLNWRKQASERVFSSSFIKTGASLTLILQALLTCYLFTSSHAPLNAPSSFSRYLICLWLVVPVLLWPLFQSMQKLYKHKRIFSLVPACVLVVLVISSSYGTYITLGEVSQARAAYDKEEVLISALEEHGISQVYTDYWTCYRLAFQSNEHVTCAVIKGDCSLQPDHHNRYAPYSIRAQSNPTTPFLLGKNSRCDTVLQKRGFCRSFSVGDYNVYEAYIHKPIVCKNN